MIATEGIVAAGMQLVSAVCRHYWPASLIGAIVSKRCRRVLIVAALADGVADWMSRARTVENASEHIGLVPYVALRRLDDLAYGFGLWSGVVRERTFGPLKPRIRS